jgi:hypothetical protein
MASSVVLANWPAPVLFSETGANQAVAAAVLVTEVSAAVAYTLTAEAGSFTHTGQDVQFGRQVARQFIVSAWPRPIIVTESASQQALLANVILTEATTQAAASLSAQYGAFGLTGQDASLVLSSDQPALGATFTLTGSAANLSYGRVLTASRGTFVYTLAGVIQTLEAFTGSFGVAGSAATLTYAASTTTLSAAGAAFALVGQDAELARSLPLPAAVGEIALSGQAATFLRGYGLVSEVGAFVLLGLPVGLVPSNESFIASPIGAASFIASPVS